MNRTVIDDHLRALQRDARSLQARSHVDALRRTLGEPWLDGALARKVTDALTAAGVSASWSPAPLRTGETWLLVCTVSATSGEAVRWRSREREGSVGFTADSTEALERAWRGLLATLAGEGRSLPLDFTRGGFEAPALARWDRIEGASLGVAACLAWLSRACGRPAPEHLAASAAVQSDGALTPVAHLREKLAALPFSAPAVTTVIVAADQPDVHDLPPGVTLTRCRTLADALKLGALPLDTLPTCMVDDLAHRVTEFRRENARSHSSARWRALSEEAWAVSRALAHEAAEQAASVEARTWSALFALHGGDDRAARDIVRGVGPSEDPALRVWQAVVEASAKIDGAQFEEAVAVVERVLPAASELSITHRWMEGHARGTRGRALLHGGRHAEALTALTDAVRWFEAQKLPWEAARTSKDVATCHRLMGDGSRALAVVDRALQTLEESARRREVSAKTRDFLLLERGRCLLAVRRAHEAIDPFEQVVGAQSADGDYPRLGAVRGLVVAHRRGGRHVEAREMLTRCMAVAQTQEAGTVLGRVATVAAAEAQVDGDDEGAAALRALWERHHGVALTDAHARRTLARQVY